MAIMLTKFKAVKHLPPALPQKPIRRTDELSTLFHRWHVTHTPPAACSLSSHYAPT
jgi:hypothetical protein